jgi:uncharacterized delta-60 repeat protein
MTPTSVERRRGEVHMPAEMNGTATRDQAAPRTLGAFLTILLTTALLVVPFAALLPLLVAGLSAQSKDPTLLPKSSGLITIDRDGQLRMASASRINHKAGRVDKLGSFVVGLGYGASGFDSAAFCLVRLTPQGVLDAGFGNNGAVITPLLPLKNRDRVTVTAMLADASGRTIVVGWRYQSKGLDASVPVITAARYSGSGALDQSFGERGIITTRVDGAWVSQAFAAALDGDGRLLVAGYSGGRKGNGKGSYDDWSIKTVVLRYTANGVLDPSFGAGGVASRVLVPAGPQGRAGMDFLRYDHSKTMGLTLDRQGRAVVAAASDEGPVVLMRYTREGALDPSFGSAGTVQTAVGPHTGLSALLWDADGRLLAAGTSGETGVLLRYSADGALDATFGDGGIRKTPLSEDMRVSAALREADGHVLVVASGMNTVQLARFDRDGKPDQAFGTNGVINTAAEDGVTTTAGLAIDEKGTPIVTAAGQNGVLLLRYNRGGQVDKSFHAVPTMRP